MVTKVAGDRQGIQSIEVGFKLLNVLAAANRPMMLRDIAKGAAMPAAKAHRYMVSFLRVGIVEQDAASGRYDLGEFALSLGLAGLSRLDHVRLAGPTLEALCEKIHETVILSVWGTHGATIVRVFDAGGPVSIVIRAGTVMPLCTSATGRAFAAFSRAPYIKQMLDQELKAMAETSKTSITTVRRQLEKALTECRERGVARASGSYTPGINGFSAPVYDHTGQMVAAITSLGTMGEFNAEWDSPVVQAMLTATEELSARLGYRKDAA